MLLLHIV
jgi:hypothetical protein